MFISKRKVTWFFFLSLFKTQQKKNGISSALDKQFKFTLSEEIKR